MCSFLQAVIKRPAKTDFLPQIETSNQESLMADDDIPDMEEMTEEITEQSEEMTEEMTEEITKQSEGMTEEITEQSDIQSDSQQETETMIHEEIGCLKGVVITGVTTADEEKKTALEEEFKTEDADEMQAEGQAAQCDIVDIKQENHDEDEFVHIEVQGQDKTNGQTEGQGQKEGENPDET